MQVQPHSPPQLLADYAARPDRYDELCQRIGSVVVLRPHWRDFFHGLAAMPAAETAARREALRRQIHENGITYNVYADPRGFERPWELDLLPYILPAAEWAQIEAAVLQRATLFNRILADLYGEQSLLQQGLIPPALIYGHSGFLRPLVGAKPPRDLFLHLYAVDLARSPDGRWWVVADRTQAPSGAGYALENRGVVARALPELYRAAGVQPLVPFFETFRDGLATLAPEAGAEEKGGEGRTEDGDAPLIVVLTPGPYNETYFEHAFLAREMGFPLVEGQDLTVRDEKVFLRTLEGLRRVHVILRRVDDIWCDPLELRDDSALGVAGLVAAVRAGQVAVANALGSGILETGALLGYLPRLAEHLLGQKLKMPSVATWWCGEKAACDYTLKHLRELVVKPAYPTVGAGPLFCRDLPAAELDALAARIAARPFEFVAQEMVNISQAPVLATEDEPAAGLVARNIGLRVFAAVGPDGFRVMPGGLVRVAPETDMRVVSMQHGGGSKDAWVLSGPAAAPGPSRRPAVPGQIALRERSLAAPGLASRVAESFFWLGRYSERADGAARLGRETLGRLGGLAVLDHVGPAAGEAGAQADSPTVAALAELCRRCGVLPRAGEDTEGGEGTERVEGSAAAQALACALFDDTRSGSVVTNLRMVLRLASQLRDRLSPDSWRIYNRLAGFATPVTEAPGLGEAMHRLDESLLSLVTLSGFVIESMPRDAGWRFLSIGRRIERLQFLASALAVLLAVPHRGALEALLAVTDGEIRYRSRHARGLAPRPVAGLVMFDGDNPRALRYQLDSLIDHLARLPDGAALGEPLAELMRELDAVTDCDCLAGLAADGQATHDAAACGAVFGLLQRIWSAGNALSDAISQRYFTHLDARSHATASR